MNNSIKYTKEKGKITIIAKPYDTINGEIIKLKIKDNGIGVM